MAELTTIVKSEKKWLTSKEVIGLYWDEILNGKSSGDSMSLTLNIPLQKEETVKVIGYLESCGWGSVKYDSQKRQLHLSEFYINLE